LEDLDRHHMEDYVGRLDRPLLIVHSPQDETVAIEHAERIFQRAAYPKSLMTVEGADHLLAKRERDSRFVADLLAVWARRYLQDVGESTNAGPSASGDG
jgi:putative redox protein